MTLNLSVPKTETPLKPRITVAGVGGAGGNAINNMIQSNLEGVEFLVANTDSQAIAQSLCERRIQLGRNITQGLGAGSRPDIGRAAAEEVMDEILDYLQGSNMVFITAGMGGGTGTGGAPVIAQAAREAGILTVGVVTKPFQFEGIHRMRIAENGIIELQQYVDTLIIIPNQNLFRIANEKTTFADAFKMADDVLYSGVRGVTDLMVMPGLINLDFADIRSVMTEMGKAMMGTGEAEGEHRSVRAAEAAISNPLLDDVSMKGARGVLINITGGLDLTLFEVDEAANRIRDEVDPDANIIFGSTFDESLNGKMRVSVVATGIDIEEAAAPRPVTLSLVSSREEAAPVRPEEPPVAATQAKESGPTVAGDDDLKTAFGFATDADDLPKLSESARLFAESEDPAGLKETTGEVRSQRGEVPAEEGTGQRPDTFIAPRPRSPEPSPAPGRDFRFRSDPFAETAMAGASSERGSDVPRVGQLGRSKAHSLFARMTGAARAFQSSAAPSQDHLPRREASSATLPPFRAPGTAATRPVQTAMAQRTPSPVRNLDRPDGLNPTDVEDEMLDIPAFLRRQAN